MGGDLPYVNGEVFNRQQKHCFDEALKKFSGTRKMGNDEFCNKYLEQLEMDLNSLGYYHQLYCVCYQSVLRYI